MTDKQVCRYMELANRKSFIIMHSGASWKPEYAEELEAIDQELAEFRQVIDQEHEERSEEMSNQYLNAAQVAEIMDCSERHGYKVIQCGHLLISHQSQDEHQDISVSYHAGYGKNKCFHLRLLT